MLSKLKVDRFVFTFYSDPKSLSRTETLHPSNKHADAHRLVVWAKSICLRLAAHTVKLSTLLRWRRFFVFADNSWSLGVLGRKQAADMLRNLQTINLSCGGGRGGGITSPLEKCAGSYWVMSQYFFRAAKYGHHDIRKHLKAVLHHFKLRLR